jgi:hypothetical protein
MAAITVGTQAVELDTTSFRNPVIQNLGPGQLYFDWVPVTAATGFKLMVGAVYEFPRTMPRGHKVYLIASAPNTDVRVIGGAF